MRTRCLILALLFWGLSLAIVAVANATGESWNDGCNRWTRTSEDGWLTTNMYCGYKPGEEITW